MKNFSKVSLSALFIVLMASPAFAELASKTYVERKTSVSDDSATDVGKIAIYATDGSGQKLAAGIVASTLLTTSDLTKVGLNGATAATGTFNFYAPTTAGTAGFVLKSSGTGAPTWGSDNDHITSATTSGSGNAVTAVTADPATGAVSVVKGQTFLTSADLPAAYVLPAATNAALGGLKLAQAADAAAATLASDTTTAGRNYRVKLDNGNIAYVNIPWVDTNNITTASTSGAGNAVTAITADANGALTVTKGETFLTSFTETDPSVDVTVMGTAFTTPGTTGTAGKVYRVQKDASGKAVVSVPWTDNNTTYSAATSSALGLAKLFSDTAQSVAANAVSATAGKTYGIQNNASGQLVVNVPWTDADTTYSTLTQAIIDTGSETVGKLITGKIAKDALTTYGGGMATTAGTAPAFTVAMTGFTLQTGSKVIAEMHAAAPANSTLNVNGTGAKNIFYNGVALTSGLLNLGGVYEFVYDGTQYNVIGVDTDTVYTHPTVTRSDSTSTASLTAGGTVTIVDGVTTNAQGHLTGVNLKTATLPADANTTDLSYASDTTTANVGVLTNGSGTTGAMKTKTLTAGSNVTITGGNGTITIAATDTNTTYSAATSTALGLAKLASDTAQSIAANAVTATAGKTYGIQNNGSGQLVVNVPWTDTNNRAFNGASTAGTAAAYTLAATQPAFTAADLTPGSIVIATIHLANSASPTISIGGQTAKPIFMTDTDAAAAAGALKAGTIYSFTYNGTNWYAKPIETVYTGTAPITVSGTAISHNTSGVTAAAYGPSANATLTSGGTFTVPGFTVDANGHTTVAATRTMTMPTIPVDTNTAANLSTTSTTALSTSASESLLSGTVSLHKIAKTGTYSDLIGAPVIPALPSACTTGNASCSLNYGNCLATESADGVACGTAKYFWELVLR